MQENLTRQRRPAAFLDRDGVINLDKRYVHRPDQIEWIKGSREGVKRLNDLGYHVVVLTNQAGVGHGYYAEDDVRTLHAWMQEQLADHGAFIDAFYYCPFHPQARIEKYRGDHINRKPGPGMILQAMADLPIRRDGSFLIGDKASDIAAASAAGIPGFLFTGGNLSIFIDDCLRWNQSHLEATKS